MPCEITKWSRWFAPFRRNHGIQLPLSFFFVIGRLSYCCCTDLYNIPVQEGNKDKDDRRGTVDFFLNLAHNCVIIASACGMHTWRKQRWAHVWFDVRNSGTLFVSWCFVAFFLNPSFTQGLKSAIKSCRLDMGSK